MKVVGEAVKKCAEDYLYEKRGMALVDAIVQLEIESWAAAIAERVHFSCTVKCDREKYLNFEPHHMLWDLLVDWSIDRLSHVPVFQMW